MPSKRRSSRTVALMLSALILTADKASYQLPCRPAVGASLHSRQFGLCMIATPPRTSAIFLSIASLPCVDIGLYGEEAPRSGPLVLEKGLEGRSVEDVMLWLDAVYKHVGPATLEGAATCGMLRLPSQSDSALMKFMHEARLGVCCSDTGVLACMSGTVSLQIATALRRVRAFNERRNAA